MTARHHRPILRGAIHGRFQPMHTGHFTYLMHALRAAETVVIGVTSPFPHLGASLEASDPVRHLPANNPLTYYERLELITAAVARHDRGLLARIRIVPFDVSAGAAFYRLAIPLDVVQFVAPHEPWDREKSLRFEAAGYQVRLVPSEHPRVTATTVRALLRAGDSAWRDLVPVGTAEAIDALGIEDRLKNTHLRGTGSNQ